MIAARTPDLVSRARVAEHLRSLSDADLQAFAARLLFWRRVIPFPGPERAFTIVLLAQVSDAFADLPVHFRVTPGGFFGWHTRTRGGLRHDQSGHVDPLRRRRPRQRR